MSGLGVPKITLARKKGSDPAGQGSEAISDDKFQAQLLQEFLAGKLTEENLKNAAKEGKNSDQGVGVGAKIGEGVGVAAGGTAASTTPNDLAKETEWTVKGPTLREINSKLHHSMSFLTVLLTSIQHIFLISSKIMKK